MSDKAKKIILTILGLIVLGISLYLVKTNVNTNTSGEITIIVVDETGTEIINEKQSFDRGQTMMDILVANYDIEVDNGFLVMIEGVEARNRQEAFIQIIINDIPSPKGIKQMRFADGDIIKFIYTKIGDE